MAASGSPAPKAVVLAAGEGRRLRPLTHSRPKVMIPVAGRPLLEHVVEALAAIGVTRLAMVVGYRRESIQDHFGDGDAWGVAIEYVRQASQLGTGHALGEARDWLSGEKEFLVLPGDNYITRATLAPLVAPGPSLLVATSAQPSKYGVPRIMGGRVESIEEKPPSPTSRLVSTGIYRLPAGILEHIGGERVQLTDAVNDLVASGAPIAARESPGSWRDVVYPWDLLEVSSAALANREHLATDALIEPGARLVGPVSVGPGAVVRSGSYIVGPTLIGAGCDIGPSVYVGPSTVIGAHSRIGPMSVIENAMLLGATQVEAGCILRDAVVDEGAVVGPRCVTERGEATWLVEQETHVVKSLSAVIGQDARLGANCTLLPGAVIGPYASVAANKTVRHVPERGIVV